MNKKFEYLPFQYPEITNYILLTVERFILTNFLLRLNTGMRS